MGEMADLVRKALAAEDLDAYGDLLDPAVTWGPPGDRNPPCTSRDQVVSWYQGGLDGGARASGVDVEVRGSHLLVSMRVRGTVEARKRGGTALRYQVLTVREGRIAEIVGFNDKADALASLE